MWNETAAGGGEKWEQFTKEQAEHRCTLGDLVGRTAPLRRCFHRKRGSTLCRGPRTPICSTC